MKHNVKRGRAQASPRPISYLALYDGHQMLATIEQRADGRWHTIDLSGNTISTFATQLEAMRFYLNGGVA